MRNRFWDTVAAVLLVLLAIFLVASLLTWSWFFPVNAGFWQHRGYPRQVTNITYAQTVIDPSARTPVLNKVRISDANFPMPSCKGHAVASQSGSGWSITVRTLDQSQQTIALPDSQVRVVKYGGDKLVAIFSYVKQVFYYDQFYDSLWSGSNADGPKGSVVSCEKSLSPAQRVLVGLRDVTLLEPASAG